MKEIVWKVAKALFFTILLAVPLLFFLFLFAWNGFDDGLLDTLIFPLAPILFFVTAIFYIWLKIFNKSPSTKTGWLKFLLISSIGFVIVILITLAIFFPNLFYGPGFLYDFYSETLG